MEYLTQHADQNAFGMVEPHAEWNTLMNSAAQQIILSPNYFSGAVTFYPGNPIDVTFKNGTEASTWWLALFNNPGYVSSCAERSLDHPFESDIHVDWPP